MTTEQRQWFDTVVDRRNTNSVKWDNAAEGEIPMWIADMDFKAAPCILQALKDKIDEGVFGYTKMGEPFQNAITNWFSHKYSWEISPESIIPINGLVPGGSVALKALTEPGDEVLLMTPAYNCFFSSIRNVGCKASESKLIYDENGHASIDWEDFERRAKSAKVFLCCNPHNPTGRRWSEEELRRMNEICVKNGLAIISDEIHGELTPPGKFYTPFAKINPNATSLVSCTKSWNVAGLQVSAIICPDAEVREKIMKVINLWEHCDLNQFAPVTIQAAYSPKGEEWLNCLREYIWENYEILRKRFEQELPQCTVSPLESTYLPWINVKNLGVSAEELCKQLREKFSVWINPGTMYGEDGYVRVNIACPQSILNEGLDRIIEGMKSFCK